MVEDTPTGLLVKSSDCIMFATADWNEPYWTNKQHCAVELNRIGWRVLYVESVGLRTPNLKSSKDWKRLWGRLWKGFSSLVLGASKVANGLWILSPLVVPGGYRYYWINNVNVFIMRFLINRHERKYRFKDPLIWTYHPFMLECISNKHEKILYHCVDNLAAVPGIDVERFESAEIKLLKRCTIAYGTTKELVNKIIKINKNSFYHGNVVDFKHFSKAHGEMEWPKDVRKSDAPKIVYHGVLSDFKLDFELLMQCAKLKPEWEWYLLGNEREGQECVGLKRLCMLPNVYTLGYKKYNEIPKYLKCMNVGMLPTRLNQYTDSMFPMKYYEFVAAGLPVVSTPLQFIESSILHIEVADNPESFIEAIKKQLNNGKLNFIESKYSVGENTWEFRTKKMLKTLRQSSST